MASEEKPKETSVQQDVKEIYSYAQTNKMILTDTYLQQKKWTNQRIARALSVLKQKRMCEYEKLGDQVQIVFREAKTAIQLLQITNEDYEVYKCIEKNGNNGVWIKDIRKLTRLRDHAVDKAIKILSEQKQLIKQTTNIKGSSRKTYILAHLEPSKDVAGGSFYLDGEFDEGLVERIRNQICHRLQSSQECSITNLFNYVRGAGFEVNLSDEDIKSVISTLQMDGIVIQTVSSVTGEITYVWNNNLFDDIDALSQQSPCISCPVFSKCGVGDLANVCPENCQYFKSWVQVEMPKDKFPEKNLLVFLC